MSITEHPSTALRRDLDALQIKVSKLEREAMLSAKASITLVQKNNELTELVVRTLRLLGELERELKALKPPVS